jgi:lipopolysaccharide export system permease protein
MRVMTSLVLRSFFPVFFLGIAFFVLIIQLVDLFGNLVRYLNLEIPLVDILRVQLLFLPRAISFALPIALLFAVGHTLGTLYSNNELIAVFGSGYPLHRFVAPVWIVGLLLSVFSFFFQEYVVIDTLREKNELSRSLLNITRSFSNTDVTIRSPGGRIIYSAEYFNDVNEQLSRVILIERDANGAFTRRIDANVGEWNGTNWVWRNGIRYTADRDDTGTVRIEAERFTIIDEPRFDIAPRSFQRSARSVDEMRFPEARAWVRALQTAGQPYRVALTDYYSRFSLSLTPFIVVFLSSSLGGRFRKNILLMSLLVSLLAAVVYYVTGMVAGIVAGDGLIPPFIGAWIGVALFSVIGALLFRSART